MQDGHYHSREGCDQDHNKLCGELVTDYYELVTLLIIPNWSLLPDLSCPIPMVTSQRKFLIVDDHNNHQAKGILYWGEY